MKRVKKMVVTIWAINEPELDEPCIAFPRHRS